MTLRTYLSWWVLTALPAASVGTCLGGEAGAGADTDDALIQAVRETRVEIEAARKHLVARRKEISEERVTLSRQVQELAAAVTEKRRRHRLEVTGAQDAEGRLEELRARHQMLRGQLSVTHSMMVEARRGAETKLDIVDAVKLAPELEAIDGLLEAAAGNPEELPTAAARILDFVAGRSEASATIRRSSGRAVGPDGREVDGLFLQIAGVTALFAGSQEEDLAGIIHLVHGSICPHVWRTPAAEDRAGIAEVCGGGEARVPVDVTAGAALRAREAHRSIREHIEAGGVVMIPIFAIALVCCIVGLWKLVQLLGTRTSFDRPVTQLLQLLRAGRPEEAAALARRTRRPLRRLMEEGVAHHDSPREDLEEILHEAVIVEAPVLERHLSVLAVGAVVSPLLGLLGTVTGMIRTFGLISVFGSGDPRLLSGGISEALVTTEAGLIVAIPLVLLHAFLSRRVRRITDGLERSAVGFINALRVRNEGAAGHGDGRSEGDARANGRQGDAGAAGGTR